jgi:hypothetical protein
MLHASRRLQCLLLERLSVHNSLFNLVQLCTLALAEEDVVAVYEHALFQQ